MVKDWIFAAVLALSLSSCGAVDNIVNERMTPYVGVTAEYVVPPLNP
jgi:hypothetical protein